VTGLKKLGVAVKLGKTLPHVKELGPPLSELHIE